MFEQQHLKGRTALIVEGGGMRGIFSAGVLDAFLDENFDPFDLYIGVSAGANNLASHIAGQKGRNRKGFIELMTQKRFFKFSRWLRGKHYMDLDWLWDTLAKHIPLDNIKAIPKGEKDFYMVTTDVATGQPAYIKPTSSNVFEVMKASCAIPILYKHPIRIGNHSYVDGGVADPIPIKFAQDLKATKVVIIRSRPIDYLKRSNALVYISSLFLIRWPKLLKAVIGHAAVYRKVSAELQANQAISQIAPSDELATSRTSRDKEKLEEDYRLGYAMGKEFAVNWTIDEDLNPTETNP